MKEIYLFYCINYNYNYLLLFINVIENRSNTNKANVSKMQCLLFHENTMILDIDYYVNYSHKVLYLCYF